MLVCWQAFSLHPLGEAAKLGINTLRASSAELLVDFWLIRNSTIGIPVTTCHVHALKPDVFEAKDESSLEEFWYEHISAKQQLYLPSKLPSFSARPAAHLIKVTLLS